MVLLLLFFQVAQVFVQTVEALLPETAVVIEPVGDLLEPRPFETAGTPLRVAAAGDEAGALEHLEVLRDGGEAHRERLGELGNRGYARREARQDGPARRIGERGEGGAEVI